MSAPSPAWPDQRLHPDLPSTDDPHHLVIPWAVSLSDPCQHALGQLDAPGRLPHLATLLSRLTQAEWIRGDEYMPRTPHERLLARMAGWPEGEEEAFPWAALWAHQDGIRVEPGSAWGLVTPVHWLMGRDHLTVLHPHDLSLSEAQSRTLFDAVHPLFDSEGWRLHWAAPLRWYASHESLGRLPTAALSRVVGRNPDLWLAMSPQARLIRRLQSEVQMLLYQHGVNDEREAAGQLSVNSFWLSGTGTAAGAWPAPWALRELPGPQSALLRDDPGGWLDAWADLDAQVFGPAVKQLDAGVPLRLSLCGERHAVTLSAAPRPGMWGSLVQGLRSLGRPAAVKPSTVLAPL